MIVDFHPEASEEVLEAARFYESRQEELGTRFLDALQKALDTIEYDPYIWKADKMGRRKYLVWKFPYIVIYKVLSSRLYVLAVAHTSRKPGYWKSRDI